MVSRRNSRFCSRNRPRIAFNSKAARLCVLALLTGSLVGGLLAPKTALAKRGKWRFVTSGEGVKVYDIPEEGRSLPRFRGIATINAPALQLLAILGDVSRACEWNTACKHSILLKRTDDLRMVFHNRLKAPWPVSDRDAILRTSATISANGKTIKAKFRAIPYPSRPPARGVVRFPRLIGEYVMTVLGPNRTRVVYTIDSDSGGWLPAWVATYATKRVPIGTLAGLRKQAKRTRGVYTKFMAKYAPKPVQPTKPAAHKHRPHGHAQPSKPVPLKPVPSKPVPPKPAQPGSSSPSSR